MQTKFCSSACDEVESDLDVARNRFGLLLGCVYRQWRRQVDLSFRDLGLSDAMHMPLLVLYVEQAPMRQKDLAATLHLDTSSLVRVLAQLREAGWIIWQCEATDRRTKCIELTPSGRTLAARILQKSLEIERTILAGIPPAELETARSVLRKISLNFEAL